MDWLKVYEYFSDLPEKEQHRLFDAMKDTLFPAPKIHGVLGDIREAKFSGGLACLHCGSMSVKAERQVSRSPALLVQRLQ